MIKGVYYRLMMLLVRDSNSSNSTKATIRITARNEIRIGCRDFFVKTLGELMIQLKILRFICLGKRTSALVCRGCNMPTILPGLPVLRRWCALYGVQPRSSNF